MAHLFLLGGSGRTGGHIIDYALSKGHTLKALVRDPAKLTPQAGLTAVQGTPMNRGDVDGAIDGADAVIVALNSTRRSDTPWAKPVSPPRLMADSVANATAAMTARGIRRIVVVSAFECRRLALTPAVPDPLDDHTHQPQLHLCRPQPRRHGDPRHRHGLDAPAAGRLQQGADRRKDRRDRHPRPQAVIFISRPAVAHFAVDVIDAGPYIREAPIISRGQN